MFIPSYLILSRHNVYYFRYPLLKAKDSKVEYIKISLATRDPKEALQLAKGLEYYASEIANKCREILMDNAKAKQVIGDYLRIKLEEHKQRIDNKPYYTDKLKEWMDAVKSIEANPAPHTEEIIKELGLDIESNSEDFHTIRRYATPNLLDYYAELIEYNKEAYRIGLRPANTSKISRARKVYSLNNIAQKFLDTKAHDGWRETSINEFAAILKILKEIVGEEFNITEMDSVKAREVRDVIYKLPINRNKNPDVKNLSIFEAIEIDAPKFQPKTIRKYLGSYDAFFNWCVNEKYIEENHFSGLMDNLPKKTKNGGRYSFSEDEIKKIITEIDKKEDGLAYQDFAYWGSLIAAYTGARLNEVSQIELGDIRKEDGIWYFDMNDDGDNKKLKNESSRRKVPIHDALLKRGLIEYVEKLKSQGKTKLLYELTYCKKNGYGKKLGYFFNVRLLPKLGLKKPDVVFHCLRHTVNNTLLEADIELTKIQTIIGHTKSGGASFTYAKKGYKLSQLKTALHKLPY